MPVSTWVRKLCITMAGLLFVVGLGQAQFARADDAEEIRSVITNQLEAFKADDAVTAFSFASPTIQALFKTPENFLNTVRTGYLAVYRPQQVDFLPLVESDDGPRQDVSVVGPDGHPVIARYFMERQPDGTWKINGCILLQDEGKFA